MQADTISKIAMWRAKALDGTLTEADMTEAIKVMRQDRVGAAAASEGARRKSAKAEIPDADDLLREMGL